MDKKIIALSGAPASGKNTVTDRLHSFKNNRYVYFKKHRSYCDESEKKEEYINTSVDEFEKKIKHGDFLQFHQRYGRYYGIEKKEILEYLSSGMIPIIHIGRVQNYKTLKAAIDTLNEQEGLECEIIHILLWEERKVLKKRLEDRGEDASKIEEKLRAIDEEFDDNKSLLDRSENPYTYIIKNYDIEKTCHSIFEIVEKDRCKFGNGYDLFMKYVLMSTNLNNEGVENTEDSIGITCKKNIDKDGYLIRNRIFSRNVSFEDIKKSGENDVLEFENCIFVNIKLSEIKCREVRFVSCRVSGTVRVYKGKMKCLKFRGCDVIGNIIIEQVEGDGLSVEVLQSKIDELKTISTNLNLINFQDIDSFCGVIRFIRDSNVKEIKIGCEIGKLEIAELPHIVLTKEGKISSVELERVSKKVLRSYEKQIVDSDQNGSKEDELQRHKSVVLAALESFESRKLFEESDICLFEVRRLGIAIDMEHQRSVLKIFPMLKKIIFENFFGWGIEVKNNIISMILVCCTTDI